MHFCFLGDDVMTPVKGKWISNKQIYPYNNLSCRSGPWAPPLSIGGLSGSKCIQNFTWIFSTRLHCSVGDSAIPIFIHQVQKLIFTRIFMMLFFFHGSYVFWDLGLVSPETRIMEMCLLDFPRLEFLFPAWKLASPILRFLPSSQSFIMSVLRCFFHGCIL